MAQMVLTRAHTNGIWCIMLMVNIQELPVVTKILGLALKGEAKAFFFLNL